MAQNLELENVEYTINNSVLTAMKVKKGCTGDIIIPDYFKISEIGEEVIQDAEISAFSITLPDTVKIIRNNAFHNAEGLKKLVMSNSVEEVGEGAFSRCGVKDIVLSENITEIPHVCFFRSVIKKIVIPCMVSCICWDAFADSDLEELDLSESAVTSIELGWLSAKSKNLTKIIPSYYMQEEFYQDRYGFDLDPDGNLVRKTTAIPSHSHIVIKGSNFVITGTLSKVRADVEDDIMHYGGYASNTVKKSTDYLVVGAKPGATKLNQAKKYGIKTITEAELYAAM